MKSSTPTSTKPTTPPAGSSSPEPAAASPWKRYLVPAAAVLFVVVRWFAPVSVPEDSAIDAEQVRLGLAILTATAFLWLTEALPLAVTALLVPVLATGTGVMDAKAALAPFAHPLIFLFFGGFALATAMSKQGIDRWLANAVVRAGKGNFLVVAILLFAMTAVLSMWMSNTATTAMLMPLVIGVLQQSDAEHRHLENDYFLLLGVAYSASVGGLGTLVGSPPNGIAAQQLGIGFREWLRFGIPAVVILLPLMVAVLFLLLRPQAKAEVVAPEANFRMNHHRSLAMVVFVVTALAWMFSKQLGPLLGVTSSMDSIIALTAAVALVFFGTVSWRELEDGTEWGVLLLFGGGICLSAILKTTGASTYLAESLVDLVGSWPTLLVIGAMVLFVIFLTELSSNTATAALLVPIFAAVAAALELAPRALVIPLALAASCAFMLPVATPPNAIVFATGRVPQRVMMRTGIVLNLVFVAALAVLARFLA